MFGLLLRALQSYVGAKHSVHIWQRIVSTAGVTPFGLTSLLRYRASDWEAYIGAACDVLASERSVVLNEIGHSILDQGDRSALGRFFKFSGENYEQFLLSLEELPDRVELAVPALYLPPITVKGGGGQYQLWCYCSVPDLGPLFAGMLQSMAVHYDVPAVVEYQGEAEAGLLWHVALPDQAVCTGEVKNLSDQSFTASMSQASLARLLPMYLVLDANAHVLAAGPMIVKAFGARHILGVNVFTLFSISATAPISTLHELRVAFDDKLIFRADFGTDFRAMIVELDQSDQLLVNLSFGYDLIRSVRSLGLWERDFSRTDQAVDVVYTNEIKSLAFNELRALSTRINGARLEAEEEAITDHLTGLGNRRASDANLFEVFQKQQGFVLIYLDVDHFKQVNDQFGHGSGDQVLAKIAEILTRYAEKDTYVARVGGDEFSMIVPHLLSETELKELASKILQSLSRPMEIDGKYVLVGVSLGAVCVPQHYQGSLKQLLAQVDQALYLAKAKGRGQLVMLPA